MLRVISIFFILITIPTLSKDLVFKKDGKILKEIFLKELKSGKTLSNSKQDLNIFNTWRGYKKSYTGYSLYNLLDSIYTKRWRDSKRISFFAKDGYKQIVATKEMLKQSQGKTGILAYKETMNIGFTKFKRKGKLIDPGPLYLVWSNFSEKEKATHGDGLKWPYQLKTIDIEFD